MMPESLCCSSQDAKKARLVGELSQGHITRLLMPPALWVTGTGRSDATATSSHCSSITAQHIKLWALLAPADSSLASVPVSGSFTKLESALRKHRPLPVSSPMTSCPTH